MKRTKSVGMGMFLSVALLVGCGEDKPETPETPTVSAQCDETIADYTAFDVTHHEPQDKRLVAIDDMMVLFAQAESDPTKSASVADAIRAKYKDTTTNIQAKVLGREDKHFSGDAAVVGPAIDKAILDSLDDLAAATKTLDVSLAKQRFQKAGIYRFLYLSVMEELYEPSLEHYDEAYGYLGTGASNAEAGRRGLAKLATSRDGNNGTTLSAELFALVKEGSCIIQDALKAKGADSLASPDDDEPYARFVRRFDAKLQSVFAYSLGHELYDIDLNKTKPETAYVKLVEGEGFFRTLEPYMKSAPEGSDKAKLAAKLRTAFDAAITKAKAGDTTWITDIKATELLSDVETVFFIDVKS
jgi:hypothetical protein